MTVTKDELANIIRLRRPAVRLMALLHDLTHAPYGHTLEDEIELVDQKHDEPARQAEAFLRLALQYFAWIARNHQEDEWGATVRACPVEELDNVSAEEAHSVLEWYLDAPDLHNPPSGSAFIDAIANEWAKLLRPSTKKSHRRVSPSSLRGFVRDLAFAMRALLYLDIAHKPKGAKAKHMPPPTCAAERLLEGMLDAAGCPLTSGDRFEPLRDVFLLDIIGNTICADLLDYARRDAVNAGLKLDFDPDRIVANMTVVSHHEITEPVGDGNDTIDHPFEGEALRTAVSVFTHKLRVDAPGELIHLLQVRYYVYERVLYHPTKCVAGAMLGAALQWIGWRTLPKHLIHIGDAVFLYQISEAARLVRDLLAPHKGEYSRELCDRLSEKLANIPTGIAVSARQLLSDRLAPTKKAFVAHLRAASLLTEFDAVAKGLLAILNRLAAEKRIGDEVKLDFRWKNLLTAELLKAKPDASPTAIELVLGSLTPSIESISREVRAGIRMLDRLGARRYHKVVFRALPNSAAAKKAGLHGLTAEHIAKAFRQPSFRRLAEREIERRARLPWGTVVIHCPKAEGPTKIANILMTDGQKTTLLPTLENIGDLDEIFKAHQESVASQQNMYKSTWRLSVSVASPHEVKWRSLQDIIGCVLFQLLKGVGDGPYPNDEFMEQELQIAEGRSDVVSDDPFEGRRSLAFRGLLNALENITGFDDVLLAAQSRDPREALRRLASLLPQQGAQTSGQTSSDDGPPTVHQHGEKTWDTKSDVLAYLNRAVSVTGWNPAPLKNFKRAAGEIALLTDQQQAHVRARIRAFDDGDVHSANRLTIVQQEAWVVDLQSILVEAASLNDDAQAKPLG